MDALAPNNRLMGMLRAALSSEEQRLFVDHFHMYLNHGRKDDFVVDLDHVFTWMGFTRKDNAKTLVLKHLAPGTQYTMSLLRSATARSEVVLPAQKNVSRGGRPEERIMLTVRGFKQLCMAANTERAKQVREYYLTMEEVLFEYTASEHESTKAKLSQTEEKLDKADACMREQAADLVEARNALKDRMRLKFKREKRVYIIEDADERGVAVFKVGRSDNLTTRWQTYDAARFQTLYRYSVPCSDCVFIERAVHVFLRGCATPQKQDWFYASFEAVKCVLDYVVALFDSRLARAVQEDASGSYELLSHMYSDLVARSAELKVEPDGDDKMVPDKEPGPKVQPAKPPPTQQEEKDAEDAAATPAAGMKSGQSQDKESIKTRVRTFMATCCEVVHDVVTSSDVIRSTYRLWSRDDISKAEWHELVRFLEEHFTRKRAYDPCIGRHNASFKGIHVKPLEYYRPADPPSLYDEFVSAACVLGVNKRVPTMDLTNALMKFKEPRGLPCGHVERERRKLCDFLMRAGFVQLMSTFIVNGESVIAAGVYGLALRDAPNDFEKNLGKSIKKRKPVYKIDVASNTLLETYDSMTIASHALNTDAWYRIRTQSVVDGYRLSYDPPDPEKPWTPPPAKKLGRPPKAAAAAQG